VTDARMASGDGTLRFTGPCIVVDARCAPREFNRDFPGRGNARHADAVTNMVLCSAVCSLLRQRLVIS